MVERYLAVDGLAIHLSQSHLFYKTPHMLYK